MASPFRCTVRSGGKVHLSPLMLLEPWAKRPRIDADASWVMIAPVVKAAFDCWGASPRMMLQVRLACQDQVGNGPVSQTIRRGVVNTQKALRQTRSLVQEPLPTLEERIRNGFSAKILAWRLEVGREMSGSALRMIRQMRSKSLGMKVDLRA